MKNYNMTAQMLLLAVLAAGVVSCADSTGEAVVTSGAPADGGAATEAVTEDPALQDNLPDADLDGFAFRMTIFGDDERRMQTYYDTEDGNIINDAVYNKIRTVEDRFNVDIMLTDASMLAEDDVTLLKQSILAGDDSCELAQGHDISMANAALEGLFVNVYDIPHLDFTKPWWSKATLESMTVADQMYMMFNNISYNNLASTRVMYFNKSLMTELDLEYPYQMVYDGTWTMDAMMEMSELAYSDINGDGQTDMGDRFGYITMPYFYGVLEPFCIEPYQKDKDGTLYYEVDLEKTTRVVEKLYDLIFGEGGFMAKRSGEYENDVYLTFMEGRAMFFYSTFGRAITHFSDSEVLYGILPMPKLDETQDQYYGGSTDRPIAVPITASEKLDNIGIVVEALNAEGYKQVFPAYYETAMKTRYADQTDDAKMIDLVHENVIISFTYLYGDYKSVYNIMLENLFGATSPSKDVASWCAKNEKTQAKRVETLMEFYEENR